MSTISGTRKWQAKTAMPTPRDGLVSGAVNGKLYAVGGANFSGTEFANNEVYTPDDTWVFRDQHADRP